MTDEQLLARLADREDNYTERKSDGVKPEEIRQTVCAFSNSLTAGATAVLYIGIHDKTGAVLGVNNSDTVQKRVREAIDRCYPPITNYVMRALDVEGKIIVAVKVGASVNRPHFSGPAYVRRGSESITASEQQFIELVNSRNDKVRRILQMRGRPISVQGIVQRLQLRAVGPGGRPGASNEIVECIVDECDAHVVRLSVVATSRRVSKPLEQVQISYDEANDRPLLIVRNDR
jgi:hypothetical protein